MPCHLAARGRNHRSLGRAAYRFLDVDVVRNTRVSVSVSSSGALV
jgi:hypothetical protein